MQRGSFQLRLVMAAVGLLLLWSSPIPGIARSGDPNAELKPVASFSFGNATKLGKDAVSSDRGSAIVGKIGQVDSPFGCAAAFDGRGRISVDADDLPNLNHGFSITARVDGVGVRYRTMELA